MANVSSQIILAQDNTIRVLMYEQNKNDREIIKELNLRPQTYYDHKRRIMQQDSSKWDLVHQDSSKYYATQLMDDLNTCRNECIKMSKEKGIGYKDRMEALKTSCEASANIFKLLNEGLTFNVSISQDKLKTYRVNASEPTQEDKPKEDKDVVPVPDNEIPKDKQDKELIPSGHEPWGLSTTRGYNHDNRTVQYAPGHEFKAKRKGIIKKTIDLSKC
jgi:hypothetical protein